MSNKTTKPIYIVIPSKEYLHFKIFASTYNLSLQKLIRIATLEYIRKVSSLDNLEVND